MKRKPYQKPVWWLTAISAVLGLVIASGVLPEGSTWENLVGALVSALSGAQLRVGGGSAR